MPPKNKLQSVHFQCTCGQKFEREPDRVEDFPEDSAHPWAYFAQCGNCTGEATQIAWERNLMSAHANATGPKTPQGKAASAANLIGHPTAEETVRTRFNAMKTGIHARTATYYPAKPNEYPQCQTCEYLVNCQPGDACQKRTELYMRMHVASETGDPKVLGEINADLQAGFYALMQDMLIRIVGTGVEISAPVWHGDKDGGIHFVEYLDATTGEKKQLFDIKAHPLIKPLMDFMSKNNMTLGDMNLTARQHEEDQAAGGFLDNQNASQEKSLEYQKRSAEAQEAMAGMVRRGAERMKDDPVIKDLGDQ